MPNLSPRAVAIVRLFSLVASLFVIAALATYSIAWSRIRAPQHGKSAPAVSANVFPVLLTLAWVVELLALFTIRCKPVRLGFVTTAVASIAFGWGVLSHSAALDPSETAIPDMPAVFLLASTLLTAAGVAGKFKAPSYYCFVILASGFASLFFLPIPSPDGIRSPVGRAKTSMRTIATALEAYIVDNNAYPLSTIEARDQFSFRSNVPLPGFRRYSPGGAVALTTPVSYLTAMPPDSLSVYVHGENTFGYWAPKEGGWILLSPGPDGVFNIDFPTLQKVYRPREANPTNESRLLTYDATNGSKSSGDIWRVKE